MRFHKTSTFFAAVILCVSLNACASPNPPQSTTAQTDTNKSFPSATSLTKEFFKKYALGISSNTFNARWDNSLENELIFFRSHVRAYYAITQNLAPPNTPIDYCLGDAHVANFGFLEGKDSKARYLYNDLDDSGKCPIALDALRYFTSVQLAEDSKLAQELVNYYSQVLNGNAVATQIPESLFPNFEAVRKKLIKKNVSEKQIIRIPNSIENVSKDIVSKIGILVANAFAKEGFTNTKVLDVVQTFGQGGGSFGLIRYWALVDLAGILDIIEVKQTVQPATDLTYPAPNSTSRLDTLKQLIWTEPSAARIYQADTALNTAWVIRSRVKASLDASEYEAPVRKNIYMAQVFLLAQNHRRAYAGAPVQKLSELQSWLTSKSVELAGLYREVLKNAKAGLSQTK